MIREFAQQLVRKVVCSTKKVTLGVGASNVMMMHGNGWCGVALYGGGFVM